MLSAALLLLCFPLRIGSGSSFPRPLSGEEEQKYLALAAQGDLDARNKLVEHNLRLVSHILKKYYVPPADQDDLISIGTIGLIKGITTFRPDKKVRLATYASRCIENGIHSPRSFALGRYLSSTACIPGKKMIRLWSAKESFSGGAPGLRRVSGDASDSAGDQPDPAPIGRAQVHIHKRMTRARETCSRHCILSWYFSCG